MFGGDGEWRGTREKGVWTVQGCRDVCRGCGIMKN